MSLGPLRQAREQGTLFSERPEDFINEENPARVIDAFVEELDLRRLGFARVDPQGTDATSQGG